jgi:hypothetical protein
MICISLTKPFRDRARISQALWTRIIDRIECPGSAKHFAVPLLMARFSADAARLMAPARVRPRRLVHGQAVVDAMRMVQRNASRINFQRLHGIDQLQHPLDLRPAG